MDLNLAIICSLTFIIHLIGTLAYSVRIAGVRTRRIAVSLALFNILVLVSRTSNSFQGPFLAKRVEQTLVHPATHNLVSDFRWLLVSATVATLAGAFLIPTFQRIFSRAVQDFQVHRSVPRLLLHICFRGGLAQIRDDVSLPAPAHVTTLRAGPGISTGTIVLNIVAVSLWTVGAFAALYAGYLNPQLRVTSSQLSSLVNGVATILMFVIIDPQLSVMTDDVMEKQAKRAGFSARDCLAGWQPAGGHAAGATAADSRRQFDCVCGGEIVRWSMKRFDYDVAILGGGSAGYAAARTVAGAGLKTAVIEGGEEVGGLCILRGCMPSKALLYAAEVLHLARHGKTWGLKVKSAGFDFARVMQRKAQRIGEFADYRRQQLERGKFKFLRANARFTDPHTVELSHRSGRTTKLTARHFVISTGSVISPPPVPALDAVGYITSDHALSLQKLPRSLIVLGGGAIACELAQFFARFDVKVTVIQRSPHILKEIGEDAGRVIETVFRREDIKVFTGTKLLGAARAGANKSVTFEYEGKKVRVQAQEILLALGRSPNTAGLGLETAGVQLGHGRIVTSAGMQTSAPHIFAGGDCTGPHDVVHIAVSQGEIAGQNILHPKHPRRIDYRLLTQVVFTDPQVATVGLTEKAAVEQGISHLVANYPFNDHGKSLIMEALDGFVKLLANPRTGEIIGGACVGPVGGELIHEISAAMARRMTVHELAAMPHYHPTLAEIWTYPAEELADQILKPVAFRRQ